MKLVNARSPLRISGIINEYRDERNTIHYICNVETLPRNMLINIKKYDINRYKLTQAAMKQLKKT